MNDMNKRNNGKESYQNIPLPDELSKAVADGLKRGRRHMNRKWITGIGSLAAACAVVGVALFALPGDGARTPDPADTPAPARMAIEPEGAEHAPMTLPAVSDNMVGPVSSEEMEQANMYEPAVTDTPPDLPEFAEPSSIKITGTITEITDGQILLESSEEGAPYPSVLLNVSDETLLLTAEGFEEKTLEDLQVGDSLVAYISLMMTRSLPPMSNAILIFCDLPQDAGAPEYVQITDITADEKGNLRIVTDRELILNVSADAPVRILGSAKDVENLASMLKTGDFLLVRYSFMTMSIPAQTSPEEIVLIPHTEAEQAAEAPTAEVQTAE